MIKEKFSNLNQKENIKIMMIIVKRLLNINQEVKINQEQKRIKTLKKMMIVIVIKKKKMMMKNILII